MASSKYGYMAKIGADTSGLRNALENVEDDARNISAELRTVNDSLKFDPGNTDVLKQRYDLLSDAIENTKEKLKNLKSTEEQMNTAQKKGDISAQKYQKYQREIANTESVLRRYQTELNSTNTRLQAAEKETDELANATQELGNTADNAGKHVISFGDLLKSNIAGDLIADGLRNAASGIKDFVSQGIELASDLGEVQNVVDTTFGAGAGQIYEWSDAAAESFGMSSLSAQQYTGTLGAMMKSMGLADTEVLKMSTDMVGLAGDMASFYNLDVSTAFEKIRSGISGETEPLKQLGINMSVANLEAYALSQGIETAYNKMSEAEKAVLRYNYLMNVTADAQGDFAKTSDSYANQQRILQLQMENIATSLGEMLLPCLSGITTFFTEITKHEETVISLATGIGAFTVAMKGYTIWQSAALAIQKLKKANEGATIAQLAYNTALKANPIALVISALAALTVGVAAYASTIDSTSKEISELNDELDNLKENTEQSIADSNVEISVIEKKMQRYEELRAEYEKTGEGQNELNSLVEELQGLLPDAITLIDEETGAYQSLAGSIDSVVEAMRNKAMVGIYEESYTEALKKQIEAEETLKKAQEDSDAAKAKRREAASGLTFEGMAADIELRKTEKNLKDAQKVYDEATAEVEKLNQKVSEYSQKSEESKIEIEQSDNEDNIQDVHGKYYAGEAKRIQENAEKEKELQDKAIEDEAERLNKKLALHQLSESEYYASLKSYLEKHTNTSSEIWWKYYDEISDYEQKLTDEQQKEYETRLSEQEKAAEEQRKIAEETAEAELKAWEDSAKGVSDSLTDAYEQLIDEKEKIKHDLLDIDLSETVTTADGKEIEVLTNLDDEIKKIDKYNNSLDKLKNTGISDSLLAEIETMDFQDGSRQRFIDSLLGLSQDKLNLYYSDWERLQVKSEQVSQDIIADSAEELNTATVDAVKSTFGSMPQAAYAEGVETAQSYLQGIVDSMDGVNDIDIISKMFAGAFSGSSSSSTGKEQHKMIPASTPITINIDGKKYVETTVQDLIDKGQRTGGNPLNL